MKTWMALLLSMTLAACVTTPATPPPARLFNDRLFAPATERVSAQDVFAVSGAMKQYLNTEIADQLRTKGRQQGLFDALYSQSQLKLEYDSAMTRNAAEAYAARSGNCLSLVIMTAAFAKEIGLSVRFQSVLVDEAWSRSGDVYLSLGHVNVTLGKTESNVGLGRIEQDPMTIDFLPPKDTRGVRTRAISEATVVAMFMNNRAAEALTRGQPNNAYWWAREAIGQDPGFLSSYNTLGVIYRRNGHLDEAAQVLAYALEREPANTLVMSNFATVLNDLGRVAESRALARRLELIEPNPPFAYFNRGMAALRSGDFKAARELFAREVDRSPDYHEFHFWLAVAHVGLGEVEPARKHLAIAIENSTTRTDHDLYAAKLAQIKAREAR